MSETESQMQRRLLTEFTQQLKEHTHSSFHHCWTSSPRRLPSELPPRTLYILDSSFNPPTLAHLRIASEALLRDPGPSPSRLLLLFATQNADKAFKPAPFEHRLLMMSLFAMDLQDHLKQVKNLSSADELPSIDVGITSKPFYHDKTFAIDESGFYGSSPSSPQHVHLTGFDSLIRIFNAKYYTPNHDLRPLEPFFSKHRLRVTYRPDDKWGGRAEQDAYLADIAEGRRDHEGGKREWAEKIEFVEGKKEGEESISSTKIRQAVQAQNPDALKTLLSDRIREWVLEEGLYREGDISKV